MVLENILPGYKTIIGAVLVFVGGGITQLGMVELGGWLVSAGLGLGFVGIRYQK